MRRPIREPDPKPLPPEVDQALDDYLVALLLAELELQNQVLPTTPACGILGTVTDALGSSGQEPKQEEAR